MPTGIYPRKPLMDRIMEKVIKTDSCWLWTGAISHGYGRIGKGKKTYFVHRIVFEHFNGKIGPGLLACHRCDNPKCCNPDHIFLGNQDANMKDMARKNRHSYGEKSPNSKLTVDQVREIRALVLRGVPQKEIAPRFGISTSNISKLTTKVSWRVA